MLLLWRFKQTSAKSLSKCAMKNNADVCTCRKNADLCTEKFAWTCIFRFLHICANPDAKFQYFVHAKVKIFLLKSGFKLQKF